MAFMATRYNHVENFARPAERRQPADRLQKHLLGQIVRQMVVQHHAEDQVANRSQVTSHQHFQRGPLHAEAK